MGTFGPAGLVTKILAVISSDATITADLHGQPSAAGLRALGRRLTG